MTMTPPKEAERITEVSEASGDAEEVGVEQTEVGRLGDDTSDQTDAKMLKRNPGKQPGAPGFRAATAVAGKRLRKAPANALCLLR